jgi:sugar O-acyltransferase (sialic acid O-acetyltransferase NeuD family)
MSLQLFVFGDTSYAQLVATYAAQDSAFDVVGFTVDKAFLKTDEIGGLPILPFEELLNAPDQAQAVFVACGYRNVRMRASLFERIATHGFIMPNIFAPNCYVAPGASLGHNNIVMPGAVVEHNVQLGDNNIVWSNATLCHDATFGSHNFVAANATVGGHVRVGSRNFLGFSSTIEQYRQMGDENLLGAMSFLHKDAHDHQRWLGMPAKLAGSHADAGLAVIDPSPAPVTTPDEQSQ